MAKVNRETLRLLNGALKFLDMAFDYDGDVFRRDHNEAMELRVKLCDAINKAKGSK